MGHPSIVQAFLKSASIVSATAANFQLPIDFCISIALQNRGYYSRPVPLLAMAWPTCHMMSLVRPRMAGDLYLQHLVGQEICFHVICCMVSANKIFHWPLFNQSLTFDHSKNAASFFFFFTHGSIVANSYTTVECLTPVDLCMHKDFTCEYTVKAGLYTVKTVV